MSEMDFTNWEIVNGSFIGKVIDELGDVVTLQPSFDLSMQRIPMPQQGGIGISNIKMLTTVDGGVSEPELRIKWKTRYSVASLDKLDRDNYQKLISGARKQARTLGATLATPPSNLLTPSQSRHQ